MNETLLRYLVESTASLLVFYLFFWLVLRGETCFQFNRFYLLGSVLLAFSLPFLPMPTWFTATVTMAQLSPAQPMAMQVLEGVAAEAVIEPEDFNYWYLAYALYGLGVFYFAARLFLQIAQLQRWSKRSGVAYFLPKKTKLVHTHGQLPTFSFLNTIYLDNTQHWADGEEDQVLAHELVHIRQGHSWDILFVSVFGILFWFNPLLQLYKKALEQTHEFIADAQVVQTGNVQHYASLLLKQVFQKMDFSVGNLFFNKSLTLTRLKMMKKTNRSLPFLKLAVVVPVIGVLVAGLSAYRPADFVVPFHQLKKEEIKDSLLPTSPIAEALSSKEPIAPVNKPKVKPIAPTEEKTEVITEKSLMTISKAMQDSLKEKIYVAVEKMPEYPGGQKAMYAYLTDNFKMPAASKGLKGTVVASLVVDSKGQVGQVSILKSLHPELDKEFMRLLKEMPKWTPGAQNGKAVSVKYTIPFVLKAPVTSSNSTGVAADGRPVVAVDDKVFVAVEQMPTFAGGQEAMYRYLQETFKLPADAKEVVGIMVGSFVVNSTGKVTKAEVLKKLHPSVDKEFLRVLQTMPNWEPGRQNGKAVSVKYTIPFRIEPKK